MWGSTSTKQDMCLRTPQTGRNYPLVDHHENNGNTPVDTFSLAQCFPAADHSQGTTSALGTHEVPHRTTYQHLQPTHGELAVTPSSPTLCENTDPFFLLPQTPLHPDTEVETAAEMGYSDTQAPCATTPFSPPPPSERRPQELQLQAATHLDDRCATSAPPPLIPYTPLPEMQAVTHPLVPALYRLAQFLQTPDTSLGTDIDARGMRQLHALHCIVDQSINLFGLGSHPETRSSSSVLHHPLHNVPYAARGMHQPPHGVQPPYPASSAPRLLQPTHHAQTSNGMYHPPHVLHSASHGVQPPYPTLSAPHLLQPSHCAQTSNGMQPLHPTSYSTHHNEQGTVKRKRGRPLGSKNKKPRVDKKR